MFNKASAALSDYYYYQADIAGNSSAPDLRGTARFYPWLEGKPFLLPFAWIMRSVKINKQKHKKPVKQDEIILDVKENDENRVNNLLSRMGL